MSFFYYFIMHSNILYFKQIFCSNAWYQSFEWLHFLYYTIIPQWTCKCPKTSVLSDKFVFFFCLSIQTSKDFFSKCNHDMSVHVCFKPKTSKQTTFRNIHNTFWVKITLMRGVSCIPASLWTADVIGNRTGEFRDYWGSLNTIGFQCCNVAFWPKLMITLHFVTINPLISHPQKMADCTVEHFQQTLSLKVQTYSHRAEGFFLLFFAFEIKLH